MTFFFIISKQTVFFFYSQQIKKKVPILKWIRYIKFIGCWCWRCSAGEFTCGPVRCAVNGDVSYNSIVNPSPLRENKYKRWAGKAARTADPFPPTSLHLSPPHSCNHSLHLLSLQKVLCILRTCFGIILYASWSVELNLKALVWGRSAFTRCFVGRQLCHPDRSDGA